MEKSFSLETFENKIAHLLKRSEQLSLENQILRQKVQELSLQCKELEFKNKQAALRIQQVLSQLKIITGAS